MKNLFTIKAASIFLGAVLLLNVPVSATDGDTTDRDKKNKYSLEEHLLKNYLVFPAISEYSSYKFYDAKDNLVYEAKLKFGENPERKLVKLLNESDFLAEVKGHKIHRLKQ